MISSDLLTMRVDVERRTTVTDDYLGTSYSWTKLIRGLRGRLVPTSARERVVEMREGVIITHRFYCRKRLEADIIETDRLVRGSQIFDIRGVRDEQEQGEFLVLDLEEAK